MMSDTEMAFSVFKRLVAQKAERRQKVGTKPSLQEASMVALVFLLRDIAGSLHGIDLSLEWLRDLEYGDLHVRPLRGSTSEGGSQG